MTTITREVTEGAPSVAARMLYTTTRLTLRTAVTIGSRGPRLPWPYAAIDALASTVPTPSGVIRQPVGLPHTGAELIRAPKVAQRTGRVVLYLHGGAFFCCGINTHLGIISRLSAYADAPVLAVNYRMLPKHSITAAIDDCHDAYRWLRRHGYQPDQIVIAGDSAGGYLSLALAQQLWFEGERPAALTLLSPLLQLDPKPKQRHHNLGQDAMFSRAAFDFLHSMVTTAEGGRIYEPLNQIPPDLPPTLIHVSGCEVLLHDAQLAATKLSRLGVPVQVRVWPGQIHVFQIAAPLVPEATRSLQQIGAFIRGATP